MENHGDFRSHSVWNFSSEKISQKVAARMEPKDFAEMVQDRAAWGTTIFDSGSLVRLGVGGSLRKPLNGCTPCIVSV